MQFTATEVAAATGGTAHGPDVTVDGAGIDSRTIRPGQLFVPVVGARDGHDFVAAALAAGAPAYLTARPPTGEGTAIAVADPATALRDLGVAARARLGSRVVGITGSVGKTTTKDLLARCLSSTYVTGWSAGSFNNELGVPLTLLGAPDGAGAMVVEMGARGPGHIAWLCEVAQPTVAVVTLVAPVHLETFGTVEDVATAKGELVRALPADGTAVLNADDRRVAAMSRLTTARALTFSAAGAEGADVVADGTAVDDDLHPVFTLRSPWGSRPVRLGARGAHNMANALAAATAALAVDVPLDAIVGALAEATPSRWRMELVTTAAGVRVLNDCYNANPTSMAAALEALVRLPARRRVAVLGRMAELGPDGPAEHRRIGALARSLGVALVAVGADDYRAGYAANSATDDGKVTGVPDLDAAVAALAALDLGGGDAVLVKGSRSAGLESLVERLTTGG